MGGRHDLFRGFSERQKGASDDNDNDSAAAGHGSAGARRGYGTLSGGDDVEGGAGARRAYIRWRWRDAVGSVIQDSHRDKLKRRLVEGIEGADYAGYRKSQDELQAMRSKKVRRYYEEQNERLDDWLEVDALVRELADDILESFDPRDEDCDGIVEQRGALSRARGDIEPLLPRDERERRVRWRKYARWAININVLANVLLLAAKVIAILFSSSLSLVASLVDSALDLLCTLIIWTTSKLVSWKIKSLRRRFPVGRRRLEPIGILVFSVIMIVSFLQILQESVKKLLPGGSHVAVKLPLTAILAMVITVVLKGVIWIGCARIKSTQVQALAQDCKTDVIFNTVSLLFPLIGHAADVWWLDPVGAGVLSLYIIYDWASTSLENVARLTGVAVDDKVMKKLIYLAWRFSPVVDAYKSITAYHAGDGVWCEVDILLDEKTSLEHAHDVSETLQYCLEALDEVDRAFVTVDYTSHGPTGHVVAGG